MWVCGHTTLHPITGWPIGSLRAVLAGKYVDSQTLYLLWQHSGVSGYSAYWVSAIVLLHRRDTCWPTTDSFVSPHLVRITQRWFMSWYCSVKCNDTCAHQQNYCTIFFLPFRAFPRLSACRTSQQEPTTSPADFLNLQIVKTGGSLFMKNNFLPIIRHLWSQTAISEHCSN
jgi:hypothetical protein